jgi:hypothetical protein
MATIQAVLPYRPKSRGTLPDRSVLLWRARKGSVRDLVPHLRTRYMASHNVDQLIGLVHNQHDRLLNLDAFEYLASALVLATFSMKSMRPFESTAIASNIAFPEHAFSVHLQPIFVLHSYFSR